MKKWVVLLGVLLCVHPAGAQTREAYIDPLLRQLTRPEVQTALQRMQLPDAQVSPDAERLGGALALRRSGGVTRVGAFVQLRSEQAVAELRALGAVIGSVRSGIATAEIPVTALGRLAATAGIVSVEAAQSIPVTHDSAILAIRANEVRSLAGNEWTGSTGRGVIVAIYDTGLDFTHQDFRDSNGRTRVLMMWDQTRTGPGGPPAGFTKGHICTRDVIQRVIDNPNDGALCPQLDTNGHGTHTAGSAAGDGSSAGNGGTAFRYAGVATNADLVIVKGGNGSFAETDIIDGLRWLEQEGRRLGRPMVVNMSLGGQTGAHDGTRVYEQAIDDLARPGFIVVISAGNEGSNGNIRNRDGTPFTFEPNYIHGTGNATTGATREFTFAIPQFPPIPPTCNEVVGFSFWYETNDRLRITVVRPDGSTHSADPGVNSSADSPGGNIFIDNASRGPNVNNGDNEAVIQVNDCGASGAAPMQGTYRLRVTTLGTGSGQPYHFWMIQNFLGGANLARGGVGFDNRYIVGSPGNAKTAITVGAFTTRLCWPAPSTTSGQTCFVQVEEIGDLARFSGGGPTRDGRLKPEVVAPGMAVVSALSRNASVAGNRVVPGGVHWANQGTSMAAPLVTGAIALLLEVRPGTTAADVRQLLARTAARDRFTAKTYSTEIGAQPSDWWGYGKLDVAAALCAIGGGSSTFLRVTPAVDTLPQNAVVKLEACASGVTGVTFTSTQPAVASVDALGNVRALQLGTAQIIARAGNLADTTDIVVVAPSTVVARGASAAPSAARLAPAGTLLPLLQLGLRVNGVEAVRIESLTFALSGLDASAKLVVAHDLNRNGSLDASDRVIGSANRGVRLENDTIRVNTPTLTIAARDSAALLVGLELSGAAPNHSEFQVTFLSSATRTTGARSGAANRLEPVTTVIASATARTTVLKQGESFSMSENPIRSPRVVFNFTEPPATAGVYTLTGRRVRDLKRLLTTSGSVEWDLRNDEGSAVAPGVYLLVFDVAGQLIREKLFILTPRR